jgi:[ribosomal protein S18]-alanine N-acetyltransferase
MMTIALCGDAGRLAGLHAAAFPPAEVWSAAYLERLLVQPGVFAAAADGGFVLMRAAGGEAEILTLAVAPASRRRGLGSALVTFGAKTALEMAAEKLFLEVNVGNFAAKNLYSRLGFVEVGRRPGYYVGPQNIREDALVLGADLPLLELRNARQPG